MLQSVIVFSRGGSLLFHKEFLIHDRLKAKKLAPLLTTLLTQAEHIVGLPLCYLELHDIALAIVTNVKYKVSCCIFYDVEDGEIFGKLLATEIVESFCENFTDELEEPHSHQSAFDSFNPKIASAIQNSLSPILEHLQSQKMIQSALLINGDEIIPKNNRVDNIAFIAEYYGLMEQAQQLMTIMETQHKEVVITGSGLNLYVKKIESAGFVVTYYTHEDTEGTKALIAKYAKVLDSVLKLINNFGGEEIQYFN